MGMIDYVNNLDILGPMNTQTNRFQVIGVNDDKDFCECCGKAGLKRVVWINDAETSEVKHFGTTCATKPAKGFNLDKEIKVAINRADDYAKALNYMARIEYKKAGGKYVSAPDGMSARVADPELYAITRAACVARGFNC